MPFLAASSYTNPNPVNLHYMYAVLSPPLSMAGKRCDVQASWYLPIALSAAAGKLFGLV